MEPLAEALYLARAGRFGSVVAISQNETQYNCFQFDGVHFDEQPHLVDKGNTVTLSSHVRRMSLFEGQGIETDCTALLWRWIGQLVDPQNEWLVGEIAALCQLLETRNIQNLVDKIYTVQMRLGLRTVARDPIFGDICGLEYGAGELAAFQMPQKKPVPQSSGVRDVYIRLHLGPRLQSEGWRLTVHLKTLHGQRVSCPASHEFQSSDRPNICLKFSQVPKTGLRIVVDIFADALLIASGSCPVALNGPKECLLMVPSGEEVCSLIAAVQINVLKTGMGQIVPSLLMGGFSLFHGTHIELSDYVGPKGHSVKIGANPAIELLPSRDYGFLVTGDRAPIRLELYKGSSLVSSVTVNPLKPPRALVFPSLTSFQSLKFTKTVATAQFEMLWLGSLQPTPQVVTIENAANETQDAVISALGTIESATYFCSVLSGIFTSFTQPSTKLHRAAMSALCRVLNAAPPYCLRLYLRKNPLRADRTMLLFVLLNEIPGALKQNPQRTARCFPRFAEIIDVVAPQIITIIDLSDLQTDGTQTPSHAAAAAEPGALGLPIRTLDQLREIVRVLLLIMRETGQDTQTLVMQNIYPFFYSLRNVLGNSSVLVALHFLSQVPWGPAAQVNTLKLYMLARLSDEYTFDSKAVLYYSNVCISAIAPVWLQKTDRNWNDVRTTASIVYQLLQRVDQPSLHELYRSFLPLVFDLSLELARLGGGDIELSFFIFEPCSNNLATSIETMLISHQLLQLNYPPTVELETEQIKQIVLKALKVCCMWMGDKPMIPVSWYSVHLLRLSCVHLSLEYVAGLLAKYFLPLPHSSTPFDSALWHSFFSVLSRLILHDLFKVPQDKIELVAYQKIVGQMVPKAVNLFRMCWVSLNWDKNSRFGFHVNLFCCPKNVTEHVVQLAFSSVPSARVLAQEILVQLVETEWELNKNLDALLKELLSAINLLFFNKCPEPNPELLCALVHCSPEFTTKISTFLLLLADSFKYDSLLTLGRILSFLRENKVWTLMYQYAGLILKHERNYRALGLVFLELANIYSWEDTQQVPRVSDLPFVAEAAAERKEKLLKMAMQCFTNGNHWMLAIQIGKDLSKRYEEVLDLPKLSAALGDLSKLYANVCNEPVILPNFYVVKFQGHLGRYVFEEAPDVRIDEFRASLAKFGEFDVRTVRPVGGKEYCSASTPPWGRSCINSTLLLEFEHSQALEHSDVTNMWVERTIYTIAEPLPTICGAAAVASVHTDRLSPAENAEIALGARAKELLAVCAQHKADSEFKTDIYLELILSSVVSSPINGGIAAYRELLPEHPKLAEVFNELKAAALKALVLYGQLAKPEMRPQYELFVRLYKTNFLSAD